MLPPPTDSFHEEHMRLLTDKNFNLLEKMLEIEEVTTQNLYTIKQGESVTYQLSASAQKLEQSADAFKLIDANIAA